MIHQSSTSRYAWPHSAPTYFHIPGSLITSRAVSCGRSQKPLSATLVLRCMANRRVGECRLCGRETVLCDSHLVPAGAFRALRATELANPNPVILGAENAYTSSKQVSDYLLCDECESRLRRDGEDWVLAHIYRPDGTFPFREKLVACNPELNREGFTVYKGIEVSGLNCPALVYFGMSVFWRAAAHNWPWQGGYVNIDVGPYREALRLFLMGEAGFPDNMALIVRLSGMEQFLSVTALPTSDVDTGITCTRS